MLHIVESVPVNLSLHSLARQMAFCDQVGRDGVLVDGSWREAKLGPGCKCGDHEQSDCRETGCGCKCHN